MAKKKNRLRKSGKETRDCDLCFGSGKKFANGKTKSCPRCHGTGEIAVSI